MGDLYFKGDFVGRIEGLTDNRALAKVLTIIFWIFFAVCLSLFFSSIAQLDLLERISDGAEYTQFEIEFNDLRQGLLAFIYLFVYVGLGILYLRWFYLAYKNTHSIYCFTPALRYTAKTAIWGFLVPFISWVYPVRIMKDISFTYQTILAKKVENFQNKITDKTIHVWWGLFVFSSVISTILNRLTNDDSIENIIFATKVLAFDCALQMLVIPFAVKVVQAIKKLETKLYELNESNVQEHLLVKPVITLEKQQSRNDDEKNKSNPHKDSM